MILDDELIAFNKRGLIPGPNESESDFLARVKKLLNFSNTFSQNEKFSSHDWICANRETNELFDFSNDWMVGIYSNKKLPLWQGAATWIEEDIPLLQLKEAFRKGSYLKIYAKDEVLAHEAVHAARLAFDEPKFEERLAYLTSKSSFRKMIGPFFEASWESYLAIFLMLASIGAQFASFVFAPSPIFALCYLLPWLALFLGAIRLYRRNTTFKSSLNNIKEAINDQSKSKALALRLTDAEIVVFAKMSKEAIRAYVEEEKKKSLRWKMLSLVYF